MIIKTEGRTLYASWPAWAARILLLAVMIFVAVPALPHATLYIPGERQWGDPPLKTSDATLYKKIVRDMESGRNYYEAAAAEHRAHGYPTAPPQVFREPTLAWMLVTLHFHFLRLGALFVLYGLIMAFFFRELLDSGSSFPVRIGGVATVATGLSIAGITDGIYWHEVWAALLIAASLLSYRAASWWLAVSFGLLACLIREIAAPYLLVMAGFALFEGRWKQFLAWFGAILLFVAVFTFHILLASKLYRQGDILSGSWLVFGGWNFAIATAKWNIFLHALPYPLIALALCLGIIGLAGAPDGRARRAAVIVGGYLAAFLFVGRPDNYYWGILYAPLLPAGFLLAPAAVKDLCRRAFLVLQPADLPARELPATRDLHQ